VHEHDSNLHNGWHDPHDFVDPELLGCRTVRSAHIGWRELLDVEHDHDPAVGADHIRDAPEQCDRRNRDRASGRQSVPRRSREFFGCNHRVETLHAVTEVAVVDERQDSIRQGIGAPEESEIGQRAAEERKRLAAEGPEIGGGMGGTSDADSAADEAAKSAELNRDD
jgi:hypothetical protein